MSESQQHKLRAELLDAAERLADFLSRFSCMCKVAPGEAVFQWYVKDGQIRVAVHITRLNVV